MAFCMDDKKNQILKYILNKETPEEAFEPDTEEQALLELIARKVKSGYYGANVGEVNTDLIEDSVVTIQEGINYVDMVTGTTINLPVVNKYTEIRLWFKCTEDLSIVFPEVCWQNEPESNAGYIYEYVFTYIPNLNEWVGGFVSYELPTE